MNDRSSRQWKMRQKLRELKTKNRNDTNPLFNECLESLGNETLIFSQKKSQQIATTLIDLFPITVSGRIDWEQIFIIWDNFKIPVVSTNLDKVFQSLVDVEAVSFYYWLLDKEYRFVIEINDEELIRVGFR
ncbi:CDI toxin immunity protein [Bacillus wiedmannii]|uniref:CDI toxin immunity protein n=1 Tax=Bacillus wiedmannii TaxID=1890302 RepID=UPI0011452CEE|nr:hypothetical protein [Bacillus wiedmannii]MDF9663894.1 hypothetical protein [Bacillus wiedmannii]HDR7659005.1 hypothetical protein [Bacillus wiedmannii]